MMVIISAFGSEWLCWVEELRDWNMNIRIYFRFNDPQGSFSKFPSTQFCCTQAGGRYGMAVVGGAEGFSEGVLMNGTYGNYMLLLGRFVLLLLVLFSGQKCSWTREMALLIIFTTSIQPLPWIIKWQLRILYISATKDNLVIDSIYLCCNLCRVVWVGVTFSQFKHMIWYLATNDDIQYVWFNT